MPKRVYPDDLYLPPSPPYTRDEIMDCCFGCAFLLVCCCLVFLGVMFLNMVFVNNLYAEVPSIEIESITVSNFNLSNPIYARWNINMSMNSTKSSFEFWDSAISVFPKSKEEALWMTRLKGFGFDMRPENTTVHFALDFGGLVDVNDTTVKAIGDKITNNHGAVEFNVQFRADHPRGRSISQLKQYRYGYAYKVSTVKISCDVLLLFGSPDKTRASMLMTDKYPACMVVEPSCYAEGTCCYHESTCFKNKLLYM